MTTATAYEPRGAARQVLQCRDDEVVADGAAGTGKTTALLFKAVLVADKYPGARILLTRKTRASMTQSVLARLESSVIPQGHPSMNGPQRAYRAAYNWPNGSEIVVTGLDDAARIMSTDYDLILLFEATEATEHDFEMLTSRLRNGVVPYQQIICDCNPDAPTHWLMRRVQAGKMTRFESRHQDNPMLFDAEANDWTDAGRRYIARLDQLTGLRLQRLRFGRWVGAEGAVYDEYSPALHVIDSFPVPAEWKRYRAIDFGFTNAFTCQWWALDPDGREYLYREWYMSRRLVEDHAEIINRHSRDESYIATVADHADAEGRATLQRRGISTIAADKAVLAGIQTVQARLRVQDDGKPRLFLMRDALIERDELLAEAHKPTCLADEFPNYLWAKAASGGATKEAPVAVDDHGLDAARYLCRYLDTPSTFNWKVF